MRKKLLAALLATTAALCGVFGLSACLDIHGNGNNDGNGEGDGEISSEHNLIPVAETTATCTTNGNIAYYICGDCGKWFSDKGGQNEIIDKSSVVTYKEMLLVAANAANCTTEGNRAYYVCDECGKWYSDKGGKYEITDKTSVIIPKGHKVTQVKAKAETCTEDGNTAYYTCGGCDKWFEDGNGEREITDKTSVTVLKHHNLTPVAEKAETCTEDGNTAYYACGDCGKWYSDENAENRITNPSSVVIAKHHNLTPVEGKVATCTEDGNYAYFACGDCGKWFWDKNGKTEITKKSSAVIAKGHKFDHGICKVCSQPQPPTEGVLYTDKGGYCEVSGTESAVNTEIIIASEYNGKPVTSIGDNAFSDCRNIKLVIMPDSITSIGNEVFTNCINLTEIFIPEGLTSIGCNMFENCGKLKYNRYDNAKYLGNGSNPYTLLIEAESYSISSCTIHPATKVIYRAFKDCIYLKNITIPDSVVTIGSFAFSGSGLTSIAIGKGVTFIDVQAFYWCSDLADISIPGNVVEISDSAFSHCEGLTSVTLHDGVKVIGGYAFSNCGNLTSVTIPASVTTLGRGVFSDCSGVIIYCEAASKPDGWHAYWNSDDSPVIWNCKNNETDEDGCLNATIKGIKYSLKGQTATVERQPDNLSGSITIPQTVTYREIEYTVSSICASAFSNCSGLTSIEIPVGVLSIGKSAFQECVNLLSMIIPDGVTSIGSWSFCECESLSDITVPASVTSFGFMALSYCSSLTNITFNGTVDQWTEIKKDIGWDNQTGEYVVHCEGGDIAKS